MSIKKAVDPVAQSIYEDVRDYFFGNPNFEVYTTPREFLPAVVKEEDTPYVDPGAAYAAILGKYEPKKHVSGVPKAKQIEQLLKDYSFPFPEKFTEKDRAKIKQVWFLESVDNIFEPLRYMEVLGYYAPWDEQNIYINKYMLRNAKQHLELAQVMHQYGKKQVKLDPEKEDIFLKTVYDAVITNGFMPSESLDEFKQKAKTNVKYRDRVIKALAFPAYSTIFHEAMHRKYLRGEGRNNYKYMYPLLFHIDNLELPINLVVKKLNLSLNQYENLYNTLTYASTGTELDAQLTNFKIWYYIQTGKKIKNLKDADYAFKYAAILAGRHPQLFTWSFPEIFFQSRLYSFLSIADHLLKQYEQEEKAKGETLNVQMAKKCREQVQDVKLMQVYRLLQL